MPQFDIAFSYASEDRAYVSKIYYELKERNNDIRIYDYAKGSMADELGHNLNNYLFQIYSNMSYYTLAFISKNYKKKFNTQKEIRIAHAIAVEESRPYLLPLKLDNTLMDEVGPFIFMESRLHTVKQIVDALLVKLSNPVNVNRSFIELRNIEFFNKGWHKKQFKVDDTLVTVVVNQIRVKASSELKSDRSFRETGFLKYTNYQGVLEINNQEWIIRVDIDMWWGKIKRIHIANEKNFYEYNL
jgi:TIR domain